MPHHFKKENQREYHFPISTFEEQSMENPLFSPLRVGRSGLQIITLSSEYTAWFKPSGG